ncbi:hypothetical protein F511_37738 [Dorcoceras hygrometricum]|uniref:Uncharacterized protein n=1 Tax=Dorcoceras hygrometricum TaxID=472368 RepID=A0A2Z7C1X8_9LAMI|nr:hypothetical protein F511_37738 [Dorcoceras hygrometricum]
MKRLVVQLLGFENQLLACEATTSREIVERFQTSRGNHNTTPYELVSGTSRSVEIWNQPLTSGFDSVSYWNNCKKAAAILEELNK